MKEKKIKKLLYKSFFLYYTTPINYLIKLFLKQNLGIKIFPKNIVVEYGRLWS